MSQNEHYVPKFYLRNFLDEEEKLHAFYKPLRNKFEVTSLNRIACEKGFLEIPEEMMEELLDDEEIQEELSEEEYKELEKHRETIVEQGLGKVDTYYSDLVDDLLEIAQSDAQISTELKNSFSPYLIMQFLRTRESREQVKELFEKIQKKVISFQAEAKDIDFSWDDFQIEYKDGFEEVNHAGVMFSEEIVSKSAETISNHIWVLGKNSSESPFYTSDQPVVKKSNVSDELGSHLGFGSPGIEILFPLSPKYILIIAERSFFKVCENFENQVVDLDEDHIQYFNSLQVHRSYHQVYSRDDNFELVQEICEETPEVSEKDRDRIEFLFSELD